MKEALDKFLAGGAGGGDEAGGEMDMESVGSMFGEEGADPLMDALSSAGYADIDEGKLAKIRAILDEKPGEPGAFGGKETPEEEAAEAGVAPRGMA